MLCIPAPWIWARRPCLYRLPWWILWIFTCSGPAVSSLSLSAFWLLHSHSPFVRAFGRAGAATHIVHLLATFVASLVVSSLSHMASVISIFVLWYGRLFCCSWPISLGGDPLSMIRVTSTPIRFRSKQPTHCGLVTPSSFASKVSPMHFPKGGGFSLQICLCFNSHCIACHFGTTSFDGTCGYPGEGPPQEHFTLVSANVGSVRTNHDWKSWDAQAICLQETRIGRNNHRTATFSFQEFGFQPVYGSLLSGVIHATGWTQTPCGGTAVLGPKCATQPFCQQHDCTGLFKKLYDTKRLAFAWIQVAPQIKALVISLYAVTGASQDQKLHDENNSLLEDVFQLTSQFGSIPVILAGDFQAYPLSYAAVSSAVTIHGWSDPLTSVDNDGLFERPNTFSRDGVFSGVGEACTSIDAILLNRMAFLALHKCEVLEINGRQHRPLRCEFNWRSIMQVGFFHYKFAPLHCENVSFPTPQASTALDPPPVNPSHQGWTEGWDQAFNTTEDPDARWGVVNDFLIHSLLQAGAYWGDGPRTRAQAPIFRAKSICPRQLPNKCAATMRGRLLANLQSRVDELFIRHSRGHCSDQDRFVAQRTATKIMHGLTLLKAPISWPPFHEITLVHIQGVKKWVVEQTEIHTKEIKYSRIKAWKAKLQQSAQSGCRHVFHHLKNRLYDEPPNLVQDDSGNIIYQPNEALRCLNDKWDSVFGINAGHDDALQVLQVVWPYIHEDVHHVDLPPIDENALFQVIQKRKKNAAPGLDGWRTQELQALPAYALRPVAKFFNWVEETLGDNLPKMLTCTKQIILHKPGPADAMNKRLITILPALLLCYTGARYKQLQDWQERNMPKAIVGGIKGRTMPQLHTALRLDLDEARALQHDLVGVKLDKAKCFDRIIPSVTCALFLAFGLPKNFVNLFAKIYRGLHRHMCYKGWVNPQATTAANGVAQGCSLSLVAVNLHTKVWVLLIQHLPGIVIRAYIDDAYLWCKIQHLADLQQAIQVTKLWDQLNGQKLNDSKSVIWGTSGSSRHKIQQAFPGMHLALSFDALGTRIYTSNKDDFGFSTTTLTKVCATIDCIGALPLPMRVRSYLIGAKAIPMVTYGGDISKIPKSSLQRIQSSVVRALWRGRDMARSKWLVQVFHGAPHRTDPTIAQAYNCIMEFCRFCHQNPQDVLRLRQLWKYRDTLKFSLIQNLALACEELHIQLDQSLQLHFHSSQSVPINMLSPHDLAAGLNHIARQRAYQNADITTRKDFFTPQGLLDFHTTTKFLKKPTFQTPGPPSAQVRAESTIVGCTLTKDRLFAAGWCSTHQCRFCGTCKESLFHLVHECIAYHNAASPPCLHELGSNFALVGHVEHPYRLTAFRLQYAYADPAAAVTFVPGDDTQELWTDGSVQWQECFWLTTAAFAIVDKQGHLVHSGRVKRWNLSSFVAELWAVWHAFAQSRCAVIVYCDNQAVVRTFQRLVLTRTVGPSWRCRDWWTAILSLYEERCLQHAAPLQIQWIPAHVQEDMPAHLLTSAAAVQAGTTLEHIVHNRIADHEAKKCALRIAPVFPQIVKSMYAAAMLHQEWLVKLHCQLDTHADVAPSHATTIEDKPVVQTIAQARLQFPAWEWSATQGVFRWRPKIPRTLDPPSRWRYKSADWESVCKFASGLQWKCEKAASFAFCELGILFHNRGFRIQGDYSTITIHSVVCVIRQAFQYLAKNPGVQPFPGHFDPRYVKCAGKVLCQSAIVDAVPWLSDDVLLAVATTLNNGPGRTIESWRVPFL